MYTFYFRACAAALSATTRAKLIAVKGIHTPIYPALGQEYGEDTMRALVENGHKVIIEPKKPSSAPDPSVCHDKGDTAVPTMRYARGYRGPTLGDKVGYIDLSHIPMKYTWSSGVTIPGYAQSAAMTALRKACFSPDPPPKSIHFTDDECRLTRWERIKGWFSRNFIPA